jgi:hypothetical protein
MGHLTEWFDREFTRLHSEWREFIEKPGAEAIYRPTSNRGRYAAELVVRSARVVEQTFGGITANLWDDPFEWTLPETLTTAEKVLSYFDEVEATRKRGFELFKSDEDLTKEVMTPSGKMQLASLLLDTLVRARHHQLSAGEIQEQVKAGEETDVSSLTANVGQ